ncbi:NADH-cytochrome b5 reductase [Mycena kentingensis (nom. inval.)]|nr:NADH-cytochrome b5 reductase [Mycena kentingensis (nom. inval.)]
MRSPAVVYLLDKPGKDWSGPSGFINAEVVKKYAAPPGSKSVIMVCGPPPQVAAIAGKKAGMKQGEIGGVLKELGYKEEQVRFQVGPFSSAGAHWSLSRTLLGKVATRILEKTAFKSTLTVSTMNTDSFTPLTLTKVAPYNDNSSTFTFALPKGASSLLPVASALLVAAPIGADGAPVMRPYTPIDTKDGTGELVLLVKRYETGVMSKHIHELKVGHNLQFKGPFPKLPYNENEFEKILLIGGGSGITPFYQILTHALASDTLKTKFTLLYGNITESDILLRAELDALAAQFPQNLKVVYLLDKPAQGWTGLTGFVTADLIKKHAASPAVGSKTKICVCGPPGMVEALSGPKDGMKQGALGGVLKELGYTEDQVFKF